ncbi:MAG: hypothetical protein PUG91_06485 [Clostridiales bacterium]|nr:hypothetical protein [Clostridiales bacterium]
MDAEFVTLTEENIEREPLAPQHLREGEASRRGGQARLAEGHVFRKLNIKGCAFMGYAPLETAWTPVVGDRFLLYILPLDAGRYGRLMEERIADARAEGLAGRSALCGEIRLPVDETEDGYTLPALSFDGAALCRKRPAARRLG